PEILRTARVAWTGERVIRFEDRIHYEREILTVDPDFFALFTFPFIKGSPAAALRDPLSLVITESAALKYFGEKDPLGEILNLDDLYDFTVTGVIRDVPSNSHLQFNMAVPFEMVEKLGWITDTWDFSMALTYLELQEGTDVGDLEERISGIVRTNHPGSNIDLFLLPLTRIRLFTNFDNPDARGRIQYVAIFSLVGILVLLMASINFMNLTTARSENRGKEIGLRKVVGARRGHIARQFLSEAVFLAFAALMLSPLLIQLLLPAVNAITEETFTLLDFKDVPLALLLVGVTFLTGVLSGLYPSVVLSALQPSQTLRSKSSIGLRGTVLRKGLVVIQMSISLALIIASAVIYGQIGFLKSKDLGFNQKHVVSIPLGISKKENPELLERLRNELQSDPRIQLVSGAFTHPTMLGSQARGVVYNGRQLDEDMPINLTSVTFDFIETLEIKMVEGRSFARDFGAERGNLIVNQRFTEIMGVESAMGRKLHIGDEYQGTIVGVMQDFHLESVSSRMIGPLILFLNPNVNYIFARISPGEVATALESLEEGWKNAAPHLPFAYTFLDQELAELYSDVEGLGTALKLMA
ncbi:MAG: ABC transporter permease, partial [Candidatus Aminicenantaceae bacterium]